MTPQWSKLPLEVTYLSDDFDEWVYRKTANGEVIPEEGAIPIFKTEIMFCEKLPMELRLQARDWLIANKHYTKANAPAITPEEILVRHKARPLLLEKAYKAIQKYKLLVIVTEGQPELLNRAYFKMHDVLIGRLDRKKINFINKTLVTVDNHIIQFTMHNASFALPDFIPGEQVGYKVISNLLDL